MSILLDRETRVIVQGITATYGSNQTRGMLEYGTKVVAGVTPGRGGQRVHGVPVYDSVAEAMAEHPADASAIYVPLDGTRDAVREATASGIKLIFATADGLSVMESMIIRAVSRRAGAWLIGPNTIGMISPGKAVLGSFSPQWCLPGRVGIISRGGTVALRTAMVLTAAGIGQSSVIHIGGETVLGRNPVEYLQAFEADPETDAVVYISEVGGGKDQESSIYIETMRKPVIVMIIGRSVPPGKAMGHAGAVIGAPEHTAEAKLAQMSQAGALLARTPEEIVAHLKRTL